MRWRVRVASVLVVVLVVGVGLPPGTPLPGSFPLGWLWRLLPTPMAWGSPPVDPPAPPEKRGGAVDRGRTVSAEDSRANGGSGRPRGVGAGELPADEPVVVPPPKQSTTPAAGRFDPRTSVRDGRRSSASKSVYTNADGSITEVVSAGRVNYRVGDEWVPIDTRLVERSARGPAGDEVRLESAANDVVVSMARSGDVAHDGAANRSDLASVRLPTGETLGFGLVGAKAVAPVVKGSTARYEDLLPGADVLLEPTATGLKETVVLESADAPASWVFPLRLAGLSPSIGKDGSVELANGRGVVVARIPAGSMHDSRFDERSGEFTTSAAVRYELVEVDRRPALKVTADEAWLRDPARVYPVYVDPSVDIGTDGDVFIDSYNNGPPRNGDNVPVGTAGECCGTDGGVWKRRSFLSFGDLHGYDGYEITSATLTLHHTWSYDCNHHLPVTVSPVTSPWTVSGLASLPPSSYPGPSLGSPVGTLQINDNYPACTNSGGNRSIGADRSVALSPSLFNAWSFGWQPNYGLALTASESDPYAWKRFTSSNYGNGSLGPKLSITWQVNQPPLVTSAYPPSGYAAGTLTPQFMVAATDLGPMRYKFTIVNVDENLSVVAESGWLTSPLWQVPPNTLSWGTTYLWYATVDDNWESTNTEYRVLSVRVPQPMITGGLAQNPDGPGFSAQIGNYTTSATDAHVETVGPDLEIVRSYNSRDPRTTGAFGAGWSSLLDARVVLAGGTAASPTLVTLRYPTGQEVTFGRNPDGSWDAGSGRFSILSAPAAGYELKDKNATTFTFDQALGGDAYGLTKITDAAGRQLTLTYASGKVATITSASGRALHVTWTTTTPARVASVETDPADPLNPTTSTSKWVYGYDAGRLVSVCPPATPTICQSYVYDSGEAFSMHPTAVLDASPRTYLRLDGTATVTNAATDSLHVSTGVGTNVSAATCPCPSGSGAAFNGTSSYVELPGEIAALGGLEQSVSLWFRTNTAGLLLAQQSAAAGQAAPYWFPMLYVGTDGKLRGKFYDLGGDSTFMVSPGAVTNGQWHHAVLTSTAGAQALYVDGQVAQTTSYPRTPLVGLEHVLVGAGQWWLYPQTSGGQSFFTGSIADLALFDRALPASTVSSLYATGSVAARPLTSMTRPASPPAAPSAQIHYDQATGRVATVTDANNLVWTLGAPQRSGSDATYASAVLGAGPSNYWRLQQTGGGGFAVNAVNGLGGVSGMAENPVTLTSVGLGVAGPFAGIATNPPTAASFDGTSSSMQASATPVDATNPFSVSAWVKLDTEATDQCVMDLPAATGSAFTLCYQHTQDRWRVETGGPSLDGPDGAVNSGVWTHLTVTVDPPAGKVFLYVNGEEVAGTASAPAWSLAATAMTVGNRSGGAFLDGALAELATFPRALTGPDVAAQYQAYHASTGSPVNTFTTTDSLGASSSTVHDVLAGGRVIRTIDTRGYATVYGYDAGGFLRTVTDPNGNTTVTGHDARGNVVSRSTCQDQSQSTCSTAYYTYWPEGDSSRTLSPDPRNDVRLTERDGRSADKDDPTYLTTFAFDEHGNNISVTDPLGRVTSTVYSTGSEPATDTGTVPPGLPLTVTAPGGGVRTMQYTHSGDVSVAIDASGKRTEYDYDGLGRVIEAREIFDAHPADQPTGPVTLVTTYTYDKNSQPATTTAPAVINAVTGATHQARTTMEYFPDGQLRSTTVEDISPTGGDAARLTEQGYNQYGQLAWVSDAEGRRTAYEYDLRGNQVSQTPTDALGTATGPTITLEYDSEKHLRTRKVKDYYGADQDLVLESRDYDPAGRLQRVVDVRNWETTYTYTDNNLLATVTRGEGGPTGATFVLEKRGYDGAGNLVSITTADGTLTTEYSVDAVGRIVSTVVDPGGLNRTTAYTYDRDDNIVSTVVSDASGSARSDALFDLSGNLLAQTAYPDGPSAPVGRWRLDETMGTVAADASGNSPATAAGGATWSTDHDGSVQLGGTGTLTTDGPVLDTTRSFTVAAWVKLSQTPSGDRFAVTQDGTRRMGFAIGYEQAQNAWRVSMATPNSDTAEVVYRSTSTPAVGVWTHLVGVYDATYGRLKLYVDGVQEADGAQTQHYDAATGPLRISGGVWGGTVQGHWPGSIDDVRVYQTALDASQVAAIAAGTAPQTQTVVRTSTRYDQRGLPTYSTDPNGVSIIVRHDQAGQPTITETVPAALVEEHGTAPVSVPVESRVGYDTFGEVTETMDPNGRIVTTSYNANGQPDGQTLPDYDPPDGGPTIVGVHSTVQYDPLGRVWRITDPGGNVTERQYDTLGRLEHLITPDGTTTYAYWLSGQLKQVTDPTGAVARADWNYLGRQTSTTKVVRQPSGPAVEYVTSYEYWPSGAIKKVTPPGPGRNPTQYLANAVGETTAMTDGAGNTYHYGYDFAGRSVATLLPDGSGQRISYDGAGRPVNTQTLDTDGTTALATSSVTYDRAGYPISTTDPANHETRYSYDPLGRLTTVTEPVSATASIISTYGYDASGAQTRFTNGRGQEFWTTYNSWALPEKLIEPSTTAQQDLADRTFTTVYDENGLAAKQLLPGGVTITNAYDGMGRLTSAAGTGAEAATTTREFAYDGAGRPVELTADGGTSQLTWDDRGLLLSVTGPSGNSSYHYTPDGLLDERVDAAGTTAYGYDSAARLATIANPAAVNLELSYNSLNQIETIRYIDGASDRYRHLGYDAQHRLESDVVALPVPSTVELGRIDYGYDANGNITTKNTAGFAGAAENTYTYDWANRLVSWLEDTSTSTTLTEYTYDDAGNRTRAGDRTFTYDERNRLVSDSLGNAYTYTARGTRATQTTPTQTTLTTASDAFGQVKTQQAAGSQVTYTYDGLGRLIQSGFSYTGLGNDLASDGSTSYVRDPTGGLIAASSGTNNRLVWTDQHTDVVGQFTAASTSLTGSATYDPLGRIRASSGLIGSLGYQSEYTDQLTGRVNMHSRWYNPDTGQFDNRDTQPQPSVPASINANGYAYANANPLSGTDPSGHVVRMDGGGGGACAGNSDECQMLQLQEQLRIQEAALAKAQADSKINIVDFLKQMGLAFFLDMIGWTSLVGCVVKGSAWDCVDLAMNVLPIGKILSMGKKLYNAVDNVMAGYKAWKRITTAAKNIMNTTRRMVDDLRAQLDALRRKLSSKPPTHTPNAPHPPSSPHSPGNPSTPSAPKPPPSAPKPPPSAPKPPPAAKPTPPHAPAAPPKPPAPPKPHQAPESPSRPADNPAKPPRQEGGSCPVPWAGAMDEMHSFDPSTLVLMADGTAVRIDEIQIGDKVTATDPETGKTYARTVTALHRNEDTDLTDVTVSPTPVPAGQTVTTGEGDGDRSTRGPTAVLKTTAHHPFWDATTKSWVDAADLKPGVSTLTGPDGETLYVTAVHSYTGLHDMRDLTVASTHTYYVLAGETPVLVHNNDGVPCGVDVSRSDAEISVMHNDSGSGMIATLDNDGILRLAVYRNDGSPLSGRQMFDMAMGHFGDRVRGIEGNWFRGTNLDGFNALTAGGHSLPVAAAQTWTGRQAARYGFSAVESVLTRGPTGAFSAVTALFRRP